MPTVENKNVVLTVSENELERYLNMGYNIIDDNGNVVKESVPRDLGVLQKAYQYHKTRINELEEEVKRCKAQIKDLKQPEADEPKEPEDSSDNPGEEDNDGESADAVSEKRLGQTPKGRKRQTDW